MTELLQKLRNQKAYLVPPTLGFDDTVAEHYLNYVETEESDEFDEECLLKQADVSCLPVSLQCYRIMFEECRRYHFACGCSVYFPVLADKVKPKVILVGSQFFRGFCLKHTTEINEMLCNGSPREGFAFCEPLMVRDEDDDEREEEFDEVETLITSLTHKFFMVRTAFLEKIAKAVKGSKQLFAQLKYHKIQSAKVLRTLPNEIKDVVTIAVPIELLESYAGVSPQQPPEEAARKFLDLLDKHLGILKVRPKIRIERLKLRIRPKKGI